MSETYDVQAELKRQNEEEASKRFGKPTVVEEEKKPTPGQPQPEEESHDRLSRSDRRRMNALIREAAEARGRASAFEERNQFLEELLGREGKSKAITRAADEEPKRENFKSDAEFAAAVARFAVKQEVQQTTAENRHLEELQTQIAQARDYYDEQVKLIPEWEKIEKEAEELDLRDQLTLHLLFATSEMRAHLTEYFVEHRKEWDRLCALKSNEIEQRRFFHRIEGKVESVYNERQKKVSQKEEKKSAAELDAAKPKPSEAVTPRGGIASNSDVPMLLSDGKTINPAWKAAQNAKDGLRP